MGLDRRTAQACRPYQRLFQLVYLLALDGVELMLLVGGVEDVALHQEVLERPGRRMNDRPFGGTVNDPRVRRRLSERVVAMGNELDLRQRGVRRGELDP